MKFTKMQGCGNDYIYVNGFQEQVDDAEKPELARRLSDRHFGIGSDGLIFINPGSEADFEMEMYNADGSRAEMCGNGIRCVAKYVYDKGLTDSKHISVVSAGKVKQLDLTVERDPEHPESRGVVTKVRVNMGSPVTEPDLIPVKAGGPRAVDEPILVDGKEYRMTCVSMGNPHAVVFMPGVAELKLEQIGPSFEHHDRFPARTNTEFVEILDRKTCFMRVWERGSGETLACGTGCCAVAVAGVLNDLTDSAVTVKLLGGELYIEWDREKNLVYMTGPAVTVFEGVLPDPH
ncbi:MAG: diaminopimelate epimerase [Lachnospiraceae bacterium]|nr:diaminopimelate epimerase [Lachnospiraceae bacterium]